MKYIKEFEKYERYKVNDYVLFYDNDITDDNKITNGKIIDVFIRNGAIYYEIESVEGDKIGYHTSVIENEIYRLATPDEYNNKKMAIKYNI